MSCNRENERSMEGAGPSRDKNVVGRHQKVVRDVFGNLWICPDDVDETRDLASQGCWRSGDKPGAGAPPADETSAEGQDRDENGRGSEEPA